MKTEQNKLEQEIIDRCSPKVKTILDFYNTHMLDLKVNSKEVHCGR